MGTLNESPVWEAGVRHFEANAVLTGGPDCPDNLPLSDLANRTAWLKQQVESAQNGLAGHEAAADPHPQYLTSAEGDAKVTAHLAAADPHPQYATDADLANHASAADPHPAYWNNVRGDAKIAAAIAALVNSSPATLDTLAELATALGNDPNFATTITNSLATKATQAGVQGQTYTAFTTTGATGAFVLTPNPAIAAYAAGQRFRVKFHADGNGADTMNVSGLGLKNIKQYDNAGTKVAAVIAASQLADVEYDGVDLVILDPLPPKAFKQIQPISASVAGNALTLTLNPTSLDFRASVLNSGTVNTRSVAAAISLVVPSGATLGTSNNQAARLALLAIDNAGAVEPAVANLAGGLNLDETTLISTTAISAAATSANVIYSTTARANVPFRVVGFIDITEAAAGTWATAPTVIQGQGGQALAAMSSLGYGQTWQSFTIGSQRALDTTYYNTTGRPIVLAILGYATGSWSTAQITVNGVYAGILMYHGSITGRSSPTIVVPPGASYRVNSGSGATLEGWSELR